MRRPARQAIPLADVGLLHDPVRRTAARPIGVTCKDRATLSMWSARQRVSTGPGATALTRTFGPNARASDFVRQFAAALLAA